MSVSSPQHSHSHCLIFDPIPFNGGSKIATAEIVRQTLPAGARFTVFSCDPQSWNTIADEHSQQLKVLPFKTPRKFVQATTGWMFWFKHLYFAFMLMSVMLKTRHINCLVGISGPGVDMALYLCNKLLRKRLVQFIHGPVSASRSIGYALTQASTVYYLESCYPSIKQALANYYERAIGTETGAALARFQIHAPHFFSFTNGLSQSGWPTKCHYDQPRIFWAASLLKWKGLETLTTAIQELPTNQNHLCDICYIQPKNIALPQFNAPYNISGVSWHHEPDDLDTIRSECNIFVSTSHNEPFGLSILEALAAGLCVLIPQDNAYWDQKLEHDINCIKYQPDDPQSLTQAIQSLLNHPQSIKRIGLTGRCYAENYRAETCYQSVVADLSGHPLTRTSTNEGQSYA